jgi:hypothetical protein
MSKERKLTIDELDAVSGGSTNGGNVTAGWDLGRNTSGWGWGDGGGGGDAGPAIDAWNKCLGVFGY